jgi:predicted DNA binding protein
MSVIVEFRVAADDFELGRVLTADRNAAVELEAIVPMGEATVPLWWQRDPASDSFIETLRAHSSVADAAQVDVVDGRTVFTLDCTSDDELFGAISDHEGDVLSAVGTPRAWEFKLEFPSQQTLTTFTGDCADAGIEVEATRVYTPTEPAVGPDFGLTEPQREAITLAVNWGYYNIPRGCTTQALADELEISDQAVTERLRRAIDTLVSNTIMLSGDTDS